MRKTLRRIVRRADMSKLRYGLSIDVELRGATLITGRAGITIRLK
jgi:hypothetical protein